MKVLIIGGGFTGLSTAERLVGEGCSVTIVESENSLGGLAGGYREEGWKWSLEFFYHHIFTNDKEIKSLAEKVGWPMVEYSPLTTSFIDSEEIQLDSPISVLKFGKIGLLSRLWMGVGLAFLKIIPDGKWLERYRVVDMLPWLIGREGYKTIWLKLLKAKFGSYYDQVNMAWFWTRVAKRTKNLGYFEGGFQKLADNIGEYLKEKGVEIRLGVAVKDIERKGNKWIVEGEEFDKVLFTTPAPVVEKIMPGLVRWPKIDYLYGQTLVLSLKKKLINGYWMNILEKNWPFLVAVQHTNMVDSKHYGRDEVLYLGNYLEEGDGRLKMSKNELLKLYLPYLKRINNEFDKSWIRKMKLFVKPYSQPVFPINYSALVPGYKTSEKDVYVANMSMVYPFDRGTNYAVKMGKEVAELMLSDL